jgi:large subunit ribosomal protein L1
MTKDLNKKLKQVHGKRYVAIRDGLDRNKTYKLSDALKEVKARAKSKMDETIEVAIRLGIDPADTNSVVRGVFSLPNGLGKTVRVAVFAKGAKAEEAKKAGADVIGAEELADQINGGQINFERVIATPDMMGVVGKVAKVLGPKGLMPNPKLGTVTMDITKAVTEAKAGQVEFRAEKAGIIHAGIAKASFDEAKIRENIKALVDALNKAKPQNSKGNYFRKASISSTHGVGVKVDVSDIIAA